MDKVSTRRDMTIWSDASEEAEANCFAAELLLPEFLFKSRCVGEPSIARLDDLAKTFRTRCSFRKFLASQTAVRV